MGAGLFIDRFQEGMPVPYNCMQDKVCVVLCRPPPPLGKTLVVLTGSKKKKKLRTNLGATTR